MGLSRYMELAGADDPLVVKVLDGKSPRERAAQLVRGTKLNDVALRKKLAEGGPQAVQASDDPMLALARLVDPPAREVRETYQQQVEEPLRQAYGKIAQARFALAGKEIYPDATFTLRLAFGVVRGYREEGIDLPPWTTIGGAFRACPDARQYPAVCTARQLDQGQGPARPGGSVQFRQHGRHHRWQLGQPGGESGRRVRRHHFRRQHPVAGARFRLYRRAVAGAGGPLAAPFSKRCARFIMPIELVDELRPSRWPGSVDKIAGAEPAFEFSPADHVGLMISPHAGAMTVSHSSEFFLPRAFLQGCRRWRNISKVADSTGVDLTGGELLTRSLVLRRILLREVLAARREVSSPSCCRLRWRPSWPTW